MKNLYFLILAFLIPNVISAQLTWSEDIAPILYENCTACHHDGGIAPFSLMTWPDALGAVNLMGNAIESGKMPPWPPDTTYQRFAHERVLNEVEIANILDWISNGSPEGNADLAPPPPVYSDDGQIDVPYDLELTMPMHTSSANGQSDDYSCFAIPTELTEGEKIRAIELIPGNPEIVHHALVFVDNEGTYQTDTSGYCMGPQEGLVAGYTPGAVPAVFPSDGEEFNLGVNIDAGANIIMAMHYPNGSGGMTDQSKVRIWFYPDETNMREIFTAPVIQNWSFLLPPEQFTEVTNTFSDFPTDASVFSVFPHMHLLGKSIESYAVTPVNDTIPFVRINQWKFHWQQFYAFRNLIRVPAFSTVHGLGIYDNTSQNPHNPNTPPITVTAGLNTTDEMFLIYFQFLPYVEGDELMDLESLTQFGVNSGIVASSSGSAIDVFPNPASDRVRFALNLDVASTVSLYLYDTRGKLVDRIVQRTLMPAGPQEIFYPIENNMNPGIYIYSANVDGVMSSGKLVVE